MHFTAKIEKELFLELLLYIIGIFSISHFYHQNLFLTFLVALAWIVGLFLWHKSHDIIFFIVGAIVGPIGEIICIHFGVRSYANPSFLGIPIWLPFAWGLAVLLIKRISETLVIVKLR